MGWIFFGSCFCFSLGFSWLLHRTQASIFGRQGRAGGAAELKWPIFGINISFWVLFFDACFYFLKHHFSIYCLSCCSLHSSSNVPQFSPLNFRPQTRKQSPITTARIGTLSWPTRSMNFHLHCSHRGAERFQSEAFRTFGAAGHVRTAWKMVALVIIFRG